MDGYGRKRLTALSILLTGIFGVATAFVDSVVPFLIMRVICGACTLVGITLLSLLVLLSLLSQSLLPRKAVLADRKKALSLEDDDDDDLVWEGAAEKLEKLKVACKVNKMIQITLLAQND